MSSVHVHSHGGPTSASVGVKVLLAVIMAAFVVATAVGVVKLWPHHIPAKQAWLYSGATLVQGTITSLVPDDGQSGHMVVQLDSGSSVNVPADPSAPLGQTHVGQRVQIIDEVATPGTYIFFDYDRGVPLLILAAVFVAVVIAVARLKGLFALLGLAIAVAAVWVFTLPSLVVGHNALLVALVTAALVMFIVVYLAHGVSVKTTTALLGTFAGVALVTALAWWAIPGTSLTPLQDENMAQIPNTLPGVDVRGVLLCGMVLAGVGVLNDVTVTQASSVWELRAAAPTATRRSIFTHAMSIGRDHIASTVYTIAFAYVGTAIGMLLLASHIDFSAIQLLTFNEVASPIVATLVASIALVATIPVTTALAAWLAGPARTITDDGDKQGATGRPEARRVMVD
ncbi:MAG: YibE/F family protein [Propionibacteriaceae bacterium]|nr:YibE/F family protein [Propionibacteriaceae bacterium]